MESLPQSVIGFGDERLFPGDELSHLAIRRHPVLARQQVHCGTRDSPVARRRTESRCLHLVAYSQVDAYCMRPHWAPESCANCLAVHRATLERFAWFPSRYAPSLPDFF